MSYPRLFEQVDMGGMELANRIVMAPMTRSRTMQPGDVPGELMAEYYAQRASAGLIISEATQVSLQGQGYARTPGIYTEEQVQGWNKVTEAVHAKNGKMFLQLWHVGRIGSAQINGLQPIAPSADVARNTHVYTFDGPDSDARFILVDEPREVTQDDIDNAVTEFARGAKNAIRAGFDGVEIHGANGYLIDQFLRGTVNRRRDGYGGSGERRVRFLQEVTEAVIAAVGRDKVGVRLSPFIKMKDTEDPEILDTILLAAGVLDELKVANLHLCEADWEDAPDIPMDYRKRLRQEFRNPIIATGNKTPEQGEALLESGLVDLIGFGRAILANPDFPQRLLRGAPLNPVGEKNTLFAGGSRGYTDYPFLEG
ncbi:MAG: alkene reductase [Desulfovibrio sp.]|jgi:N-ethylmaleimide reductase|nr:alkene reductase [Desulfovibrio sp.]